MVKKKSEFEELLDGYSCTPNKFYSCKSKVRYDTFHEAEDASWKAKLFRNRSTRIYFCKYCMGYHLTTKKTKQ